MRAARAAMPGERASPWRHIFIVTVVLWALLTVSAVEAKNDEPTVRVTDLKHYPMNLNYFANSGVVLFQDQVENTIWRSEDAGTTWSKVESIEDGQAFALIMHQYDSNRAYVLTRENVHWRTHDRGKTWKTFFTDAQLSIFRGDWLVFHADDHDRILFNGMDCESIFCDEVVMYTIDGFTSDAKFLRGNTGGCWWAKSSDLFTTGTKDHDDSRVLCIVRGNFSPFKEDNRLLISDNYFSATSDSKGVVQEFEPNLNGFSSVQGIVNLAVVKKYLLVATTSKNTDEMALYVTDDTIHWHRAVFPSDHRLDQEAYTVLEGTNYSIQIDVMTTRPSNPMGVMLTSNSNGTYFTRNVEHTNRNMMGHVDFEKISGIQGIFLVNQVDNWEDVQKDYTAEKKVKTRITFDDGRTFESVRAGDQDVHLHSVTELNNVGRVFSSPAPGLVMGNGNQGSFIGKYAESDLYVSDDAGRTWTKALDGPHKYEFGDQGSVLLAVHDSRASDVDELKYSLDHGQKWTSLKLPDRLKVKPWVLTTTQDSTSLKFVLTGESGPNDNPKFHVISVDFEGLHEATCSESDMVDWFARVDDDGNPSCLMGHTQKYHRRKKDAECFIRQEHGRDLHADSKPCDCADADFECDFNFVRNGDKCDLAGPLIVPEGACKGDNPDATFQGSSGWRLIPGNDCKPKSGEQKDQKKEYKCSEAGISPGGPASGKITNEQTPIKGDFDSFQKHYLERGDSSSDADETIIMRPYKASTQAVGDILITHDHGKTWTPPAPLKDESIFFIVSHQYFKDMVFFVTQKGKVFYTVDRGRHFDSFNAPYPVNPQSSQSPLSFHPDRKDWLIWHGLKCPGSSSTDCHTEAQWSDDRGDNWHLLQRYAEKCEFTGSDTFHRLYNRTQTQVTCLAKTREDNEVGNPLRLMHKGEFFSLKEEPAMKLENVKDFATMAEFIVVATENQTASTLNALASLDGQEYAPAHFPYNFQVSHQHAYTVLDSSTHAVNLFVVTETTKTRRFGNIIKSNSNGTSYVLSIANVNCDDSYYVDFEKMLGLQGVVLVNVVENRGSDSEPKRLQSKISHNDGGEWAFLPPPKQDLDGKAFSCQSEKGDKTCALHIHGYTERVDHRKTYSSESVVGIMFGWGNVGPILGDAKDADTFMTTDAGISWKMVKRGRWTWSFGDRGSIIVLAQRETRTKTVTYTIDEGKTWTDYQFSDSEMVINDITTLRSGASRNFLLWGHKGDELFTVNIDFSGLTNKECQFDDKDIGKSDYDLWTPTHPKQPNGCLFGHKTYYLRKKTDRMCYNSQKLQHIYNVENCTCTRQDFECDYNFELDNHSQCSLVQGLQPMSAEQYCKENPDAIEYWEPSGYRRIPLTTCKGGYEADKTTEPHPCPGHEEEFEERRGFSGVAVFFAVVIPFGAAAAVGWWAWRNWQRKFGQIRLGEQGGFDSEAPWVKYPVIAVAAVVAVVGALPLVAGAVRRSASSLLDKVRGSGGGSYSWLHRTQRRFTTRDSFARGRADYAIVDEDEGELLGEDSDEEV